MTEAKGRPRTRGWTSSPETKDRVLEAAAEIFGAQGFTAATMADIVEKSGVSIGSIYHHFGGKAEVFLAIWTDLIERIDGRARDAVDKARADGVDDPMELYGVSTRAYLELLWENQSRARVVAMGDTPPGFDALRREQARRGSDHDIALLGLGTSRREKLLRDFLLAMRAESARVVLKCRTRAQLSDAIDTALEYIGCLNPVNFGLGQARG
ncbi:TetR/AcrR family transcriptional regulator [Nocardia nova]|jgi:AcrR family transcriptional regulator|uniref:TetR/AcrR family transcriptional regulator n=1 Tax=Nocardia nova TaxID=37330 RepID=UPI0025B1AE7C|nr:TetR/AcrR family transcriptional regulator [Nocardia nova]MDN2498745.1 TetR/AcrR family transcriptional regulator [Nocardia nova]